MAKSKLMIDLYKESDSTKKELNNLKSSAKKLKPKLDKSEAKILKLKKDIEKASKLLSNIQSERDDFQHTVQKLRIELLNLENQRDTINLQKQVAKETIQELLKMACHLLNLLKNHGYYLRIIIQIDIQLWYMV